MAMEETLKVKIDVQNGSAKKAVRETKQELEGLRKAYAQYEAANAKYRKAQGAGNTSAMSALEQTFTRLESKLQKYGVATEDVSKVSGNYKKQMSSLKAALSEYESAAGKGGNATNNFSEKMGKLGGKLKTMFLYRALRSVISGITSAMKEGVNNVAAYSSAIGESATSAGTANGVMSELHSSMEYLKNTLGAALIPILNTLLPVIRQVVDAFANAVNWVNQFITALNGGTTWYRAKKTITDYGASIAGARVEAQKLQRTLLGFDEINALNDNSSGGGGGGGANGTDYSTLYEEVPIDQNIANIAEKLKPVLDKIKKIGEKLKEIWESELVQGLLKAIFEIALDKTDTALKIIQETLETIKAILDGDFGEALHHLGNIYLTLYGEVRKGLARLHDWIVDTFPWLADMLGLDMHHIYDDTVEELDAMQEAWDTTFEEGVDAGVRSWTTYQRTAEQKLQGVNYAINTSKLVYKDMYDDIKKKTIDIKANNKSAKEAIESLKDTFAGVQQYFDWNKLTANVDTSSAVNRLARLGAAYATLQSNQVTGLSTNAAINEKLLYRAMGYANGGLVGAGEIFVAREAGPEMVGTIGGHTAVANNDQIVAAVSQGVYAAVSSALGGSGGGNTEVNVYMDSEVVARANLKGSRVLNRRYSVNAMA